MEGQYPKGEYIDFCFDGKWGSEMGLTRICNGNRNQEGLLPSIKDRTTDIPGRDGQYHFYSTFDKKQFTINYAFDALTEVEVDRIKVWLGDKKLHQLGFAEDIGTLVNPQINYTLKPNESYSITGIFTNGSHYSSIEDFFLEYGEGQYSLLYTQIEGGAGQAISLICPKTEITESELDDLGISFVYIHPSEDGEKIVGYIDVQIITKGLKKYYMAKVTSQSILKYISFDNNISSSEDGDIYKGEGSIQFTCYYPFALKTIDENNVNINSTQPNANTFINPSITPINWEFRIGLNTLLQNEEQETITFRVIQSTKDTKYIIAPPSGMKFDNYNENNDYLVINSIKGTILKCKNGIPEMLPNKSSISTKPKLYNYLIKSKTINNILQSGCLLDAISGDFNIGLESNINELTGLFSWTPIVF